MTRLSEKLKGYIHAAGVRHLADEAAALEAKVAELEQEAVGYRHLLAEYVDRSVMLACRKCGAIKGEP